MRILVYPHTMEIGGSQLNAVQLAGAVRDLGHEVIILSEPGPLVQRVFDMKMEHLEISRHRRRPSLKIAAMLAHLVRERRVDVVHGYEWPPVINSFFGPGVRYRTPIVGTVMSMSVVPFFPRTVRLLVGTEQIREAALAAGHRRVSLLEPPVDTEADHPSADGTAFRTKHGIEADEIMIAMICRLVPELKLEGLLMACNAVGELTRAGGRLRLVIVGDGRARQDVAEKAAKVNAAAGRQIVLLTGEIVDPVPAYAAADIIIGQGGSALRGMAFGKPLVVVGERGFSELLTPESAPIFLQQGWFGLGPGSLGAGSPALSLALEHLVGSLALRTKLGTFARQLVVDRFSLNRAAHLQEKAYIAAMRDRIGGGRMIVDLSRCVTGVLGSKVSTKYRRWRGTAAVDDSNASPIVAERPIGGKGEIGQKS